MAYKRNGYWYRSVRDGGKVRTEYLGTGPLAEARAERDALRRQEQEARWHAQRRERARQQAVDAHVDAVLERARYLTRAALLVNGYHTHNRQWRKARGGDEAQSVDRATAQRDE